MHTSAVELIRRIAADVRREVIEHIGTSDDKCDFVADELHLRLAEHGVSSELIDGVFQVDIASAEPRDPSEPLLWRHVWVEVDDTIVDATGDQFNSLLQVPRPEVFLGVDARYQRRSVRKPVGMFRELFNKQRSASQ